MNKRMSKKISNKMNNNKDNCIKKNCKKELLNLSKVPSIFQVNYECTKSTDNYKEQNKCMTKKMINFSKFGENIYKCEKKYCKKKNNSNKNSLKLSRKSK